MNYDILYFQWKKVFAERFQLRNNWLRGRCTVRTFEGHSQGNLTNQINRR